MVRPLSRLAVVGLLFAALALALPATATATGVRASTGAGTCAHPAAYPPTADATIQSSSTEVYVGEKIKASGVNYCPDEDVRLTIGGKFLATAHTDTSGAFDPEVVVPGPVGDQQLCGVGASGLPTDTDCLTLTTRATAGSGASQGAASASGSNNTAFTGTDVAALTALAAILLAGGLAFATAGRPRKTVASR